MDAIREVLRTIKTLRRLATSDEQRQLDFLSERTKLAEIEWREAQGISFATERPAVALPRWQASEAPKDRKIVIVANINYADESGGYAYPFTGLAQWQEATSEHRAVWVHPENRMAIAYNEGEQLVVFYWSDVPGEEIGK